MEAALVDDEWVRMTGGPWTARLMRKARQPASTADYRVFGVAVSFDAERFPAYTLTAQSSLSTCQGLRLEASCATCRPNSVSRAGRMC